jgi:hypothetical protein
MLSFLNVNLLIFCRASKPKKSSATGGDTSSYPSLHSHMRSPNWLRRSRSRSPRRVRSPSPLAASNLRRSRSSEERERVRDQIRRAVAEAREEASRLRANRGAQDPSSDILLDARSRAQAMRGRFETMRGQHYNPHRSVIPMPLPSANRHATGGRGMHGIL